MGFNYSINHLGKLSCMWKIGRNQCGTKINYIPYIWHILKKYPLFSNNKKSSSLGTIGKLESRNTFERKPKFYLTIHLYMIQLYTLYIKTLLLFYLRNKIFKKRNVGLLWDRQFMGFISPLTWESVVVCRAKINVISLLLGFSQVVKYN